jgi:hypothetical protein
MWLFLLLALSLLFLQFRRDPRVGLAARSDGRLAQVIQTQKRYNDESTWAGEKSRFASRFSEWGKQSLAWMLSWVRPG